MLAICSKRDILVRKPITSLWRLLCSETKESNNTLTIENMKPSKMFEKQLNKEQKKNYTKTLAEFEIFMYMGKVVPLKMTEDDWRKTLQFDNLPEKVGFWEYLALTERRKQQREFKKNGGMTEEYKLMLNKQQEAFDAGGMGYGPEMYQLISNPMRNQKRINNIEGCKVYSSMMIGTPSIALDVQMVPTIAQRHRHELGNQMQYSISANFAAKRPMPFTFVNLPNEQFANEWLSKSVGYYGGQYVNQTILPDFTTKGIKSTFGDDKNIVYISKHARDVLDGPLKADVIAVCVSMDNRRESIGAARRENIRAYRLPFHRYVKWKSGPQFLPFPNLFNVLREVHDSGGDWGTALHNNIARRHLVDVNDVEKLKENSLRRKARDEERRELIEAIMSATQG